MIYACFQVSSLIAELASAAAAEKDLVFEEAMEDRLCAYSRAVSHFPTAVKEVNDPIIKLTFYSYIHDFMNLNLFNCQVSSCLQFKWRNGWFYSLSEKATAEGKPDPCPLHTSWLKELKIV